LVSDVFDAVDDQRFDVITANLPGLIERAKMMWRLRNGIRVS
jgi:hypothetical protein